MGSFSERRTLCESYNELSKHVVEVGIGGGVKLVT